ncbi:putative ABC transporter (ATP-binding protein) [Bradyrhizobium sp. ORS 278]|uniref:ABC transporter ATP-binding protein n=1 Tax=Bradyrhizobium sp. (strain ORS 278) TaxID=114615 RepID=UPI0001508912|nr:ABC transporter ATP-binding protein [Bradyrhizobium sp. ORS 278]CAL80115.1 putative ABC transporter (ATP-binding protein) [Bradyrhizobium sp. ORS 278]
MGGSAVIKVIGARHAYASRQVLQGVDLELRAGEIYCLLGVNGAGKTTLMHAICGRLRLDAGQVELGGRDVRDDAARAQIGFVPQNIALYPYLTVAENLGVFGRLAGVPAKDLKQEVDRAMASAGLTERAGQRTSTLSGGYQRRVNICASILHKPAALVLDEPTVGIDVDARDAVHAMLADIKTRGTAMLLTTHDLEQAQQIADRIGVLHDGRIIAEGTPDDLLRTTMGDRKEVIVILPQAPDAEKAQALAGLGFAQAQGPLEWSGLLAPEILDAGRLSALLAGAAITVKELRVRDPDIGSLFRQLVGRRAER